MSSKIVVVGGVAGGASAAAKARRTDEFAEITIYERGPYVSFANCGLPYYLGGTIEDRGELFLVSPERFKSRFNINVEVNHEVLSIQRNEKTIIVKNKETGIESEVPYDKLILAPGSFAARPNIEGVNGERIFTLWTIQDVDELKGFIEENKPQKAVVVGGGFVGLEAVEALLSLGLSVQLIEATSQILSPLDQEMTIPALNHLKNLGVDISLGSSVKGFSDRGNTVEVTLDNGRIIDADFIVLAVGSKPELDLPRDAGLTIGETGGVVVNERMETIDPHIYAAGDIVESLHLVTGKKVRIPLAGPANKQGRVAGANAAGGDMTFKGVIGTFIIKVCDFTLAKTGINEKEAGEGGFDYHVSYTHSPHHATYYPGAETMTIKLIFEKRCGRLLGAQAVGPQGIDKRIDVLATAIHGRMSVEDLEDLDLAYAPPYSSPKDPAIIGGFVSANIHRGEVNVITPKELAQAIAGGKEIQLIDVRTESEFRGGSIPGAKLIPIDLLRGRIEELDPSKPTVLYCRVAYRSYLAYKILQAHGFKELQNLSGGYMSWVMGTSE